MSTAIVGIILIIVIVLLVWLLVAVGSNQSKLRKQKILKEFSIIGTANNLSYTAQEILKGRVIGIDGIHRKMVVVEETDHRFSHFIIDLQEVKDCTVQKNFFTVPDKTATKEVYLKNIQLQIENKRTPPTQIVFYDNVQNHLYEIAELETKAKEWKGLILKFMVRHSEPVLR